VHCLRLPPTLTCTTLCPASSSSHQAGTNPSIIPSFLFFKKKKRSHDPLTKTQLLLLTRSQADLTNLVTTQTYACGVIATGSIDASIWLIILLLHRVLFYYCCTPHHPSPHVPPQLKPSFLLLQRPLSSALFNVPFPLRFKYVLFDPRASAAPLPRPGSALRCRVRLDRIARCSVFAQTYGLRDLGVLICCFLLLLPSLPLL
jgi:hypothetical protein